MIWSAGAYKSEYNLTTVATAILTPVLQRAEHRIESYITAAAFTDASAVSPTDPNAASRIKYAIGDLALVYLRQRNIVSPVSETYKENYSGVVSYDISSGKSGAALANQMTEGAILSRLSDFAKAVTFEAGESWGTGRFVSGPLNITSTTTETITSTTIINQITQTQVIFSASEPIAVAANDTISTSTSIVRIYGSSGNVIMTSTPTLANGATDGQYLILMGTDDSAAVTIQDTSVLSGSGLRLAHGRSFTLGKNDQIAFLWSADQSLWLELSRIDLF